MPMPNKDFNWRPNDRSATTLLRYQLEADRWISAVNSAQRNSQPRSISGDLSFVGLILHGAFAIILLVLLLFLQGVKSVLGWLEAIRARKKKRKELQEGLASNERLWIISDSREKKNPLKWIFYDSYGELWFLWKFLIRTVFIFGCIFIVLGLLRPVFDADFEMTDKGFLWFAGAVSVYFAFVEAD